MKLYESLIGRLYKRKLKFDSFIMSLYYIKNNPIKISENQNIYNIISDILLLLLSPKIAKKSKYKLVIVEVADNEYKAYWDKWQTPVILFYKKNENTIKIEKMFH